MRPSAPPAAPGARGPANSAGGANAAAPRTATPTGPAGEQRGAAAGAAGAGAGQAAEGQRRGGPEGAPAAGGREGRGGRGRGGPAGGGAPAPPQVAVWKWSDEDFAKAGAGQMPLGKATDEWTFGNVDDAMAKADLVLDETFMTQSTGHQPLETRSAMAYWQNGKCYLHGSTQSTVQTVAAFARWAGITPDKVVMISEYTGGGFGSKIPGSVSMAIPALLSKKANAPVMMRITREDEHYIGRARPGILARVQGRLPKRRPHRRDRHVYDLRQRSLRRAGRCAIGGHDGVARLSAGNDALARDDGADQHAAEDLAARAGRHAGHRHHGADHRQGRAQARARPGGSAQDQRAGRQRAVRSGAAATATSGLRDERLREAKRSTKARELFSWEEKKAAQRQTRTGNKVRGIGVAVSPYSGGSIGFDGLFIMKPDGRMQFQSGIGNLGTHSVIDVHRVAAEMIGVPWEQCDVVFGNTSKNLPWTCISAGSQTAHAMTRAAHAAATDAIKKLQEIAAKTNGGSPEATTSPTARCRDPAAA